MSEYVYERDLDRRRAKQLTSEQRMKLRLYELHLQEKRLEIKEREGLILYMLKHNLDSALIKYL